MMSTAGRRKGISQPHPVLRHSLGTRVSEGFSDSLPQYLLRLLLAGAVARVGLTAIAQLYDLISQSSLGRTIAVDAYLKEIAKTMAASLLGDKSGIEIEVKSEPLEIDSDRAVPFGLLVNELATNAIKHAFPDGIGRIVLGVKQVGDQIELTVADNGVGMTDKNLAKFPEKRGSDYVAIFLCVSLAARLLRRDRKQLERS